MNQNNSNSASSSNSSSSSSSSSRSSRSTRRGSIRREEGDDDDDYDDDDFGVVVDGNPAPVACAYPEKMVVYCKMFNLIDKGNSNSGSGSKTHGWTSKLSFRLFNMTLNNVYRVYTYLHKRHHQQEGV